MAACLKPEAEAEPEIEEEAETEAEAERLRWGTERLRECILPHHEG